MAWLGAVTSRADKTQRLLAHDGPVFHEARQEVLRDARDTEAMLNILLNHLDVALVDIRADVNAMPLFAVETKLTHRLGEVLPGARFTAQDIRTWSAEVSS